MSAGARSTRPRGRGSPHDHAASAQDDAASSRSALQAGTMIVQGPRGGDETAEHRALMHRHRASLRRRLRSCTAPAHGWALVARPCALTLRACIIALQACRIAAHACRSSLQACPNTLRAPAVVGGLAGRCCKLARSFARLAAAAACSHDDGACASRRGPSCTVILRACAATLRARFVICVHASRSRGLAPRSSDLAPSRSALAPWAWALAPSRRAPPPTSGLLGEVLSALAVQASARDAGSRARKDSPTWRSSAPRYAPGQPAGSGNTELSAARLSAASRPSSC